MRNCFWFTQSRKGPQRRKVFHAPAQWIAATQRRIDYYLTRWSSHQKSRSVVAHPLLRRVKKYLFVNQNLYFPIFGYRSPVHTFCIKWHGHMSVFIQRNESAVSTEPAYFGNHGITCRLYG